MKEYELIYLISPELSQDEVRKFPEKITELLQNEEAVLIETAPAPLLKKLGQPIKQRISSRSREKSEKRACYLGSVRFHLEPNKLNKLKQEIQQLPSILRIMFLYKAKRKQKPKRVLDLRRKIIRRKPEKKVELKEIEKKLEEILGQ